MFCESRDGLSQDNIVASFSLRITDTKLDALNESIITCLTHARSHMFVFFPFILKISLEPWRIIQACADPESYVRGGRTLTSLFLVDEGHPSTTKSGRSKYYY